MPASQQATWPLPGTDLLDDLLRARLDLIHAEFFELEGYPHTPQICRTAAVACRVGSVLPVRLLTEGEAWATALAGTRWQGSLDQVCPGRCPNARGCALLPLRTQSSSPVFGALLVTTDADMVSPHTLAKAEETARGLQRRREHHQLPTLPTFAATLQAAVEKLGEITNPTATLDHIVLAARGLSDDPATCYAATIYVEREMTERDQRLGLPAPQGVDANTPLYLLDRLVTSTTRGTPVACIERLPYPHAIEQAFSDKHASEGGAGDGISILDDQGEAINHHDLIAPIVPDQLMRGVIVLSAAPDHQFSKEERDALTDLAREIARHVRISRDMTRRRHADERRHTEQACDVHINTINALSSNPTAVDLPGVFAESKLALGEVISSARTKTGSQLALIATLIHQTDGEKFLMEMHDLEPDEPSVEQQFLWDANPNTTRSLTGRAVADQRVIFANNCQKHPDYLQKFPYRSETAMPLKRGDTRVGVFDVESARIEQYTVDDRLMLLLAHDQIERIMATVDLAIERWRARKREAIDRAIAPVHLKQDQVGAQRVYRETLQALVNELRQITDADKVQIYISVNQREELILGQPDYDAQGTRLVAVFTAPEEDLRQAEQRETHVAPVDGLLRYVKVIQGIAGHVFREKQRIEFYDEQQREAFPEYIDNMIDARSEVIRPILDDEQPIGILNVDSAQPRHFNRDQRYVIKLAANLAATMIVLYRLSLGEIQNRNLYQAAQRLTHTSRQTLTETIRQIFKDVYHITGSDGSFGIQWARLELLSDQANQVRSCRFPLPESGSDFAEPGAERWDQYPVFVQVREQRRARLVIDTREDVEEDLTLPWPAARCAIVVPLMLTVPGTIAQESGEDAQSCVGLLTVASEKPCNLNDSDRDSLTYYAERLALTLYNEALQHARVTLINRLSRNVLFMDYLSQQVQTAQDNLHQATRQLIARAAGDGAGANGSAIEDIRKASQIFSTIASPLKHTSDIVHWIAILANYFPIITPKARDDPGQGRLSVSAIESDMQEPINAYLQVNRLDQWKFEWTWDNDQLKARPPEILVAPNDRDKLMAAIFGCVLAIIDHCRQDATQRLSVRVSANGSYVAITLEYTAETAINKDDFNLDLHLISDEVAMNAHTLFEVRRIITALHGSVRSDAASDGRQAITITMPR